ncbi:MAG: ATP-grasp domain-containing protein [Bacteroidota bacterium]
MNKPTINWVLQSNLTKEEDAKRIKAALQAPNTLWEEIQIIPFSHQLPDLQHQADVHIPYGSTTLVLSAYAHPLYKKGLFYDPATFNVATYAEKWGQTLLNHQGQLVRFGAVEKIPSSTDQAWFIRPNHDTKTFSGQVLSFQDLLAWRDKICALELPDLNADSEVWMAPPQDIQKEWRIFIVDDQIISAGRYLDQGALSPSQADLPEEMLAFVRDRIKEYRLHDAYVMDIALTSQGFSLIECNCFNGTGFYQHDIAAIVQAVNGLFG